MAQSRLHLWGEPLFRQMGNRAFAAPSGRGKPWDEKWAANSWAAASLLSAVKNLEVTAPSCNTGPNAPPTAVG